MAYLNLARSKISTLKCRPALALSAALVLLAGLPSLANAGGDKRANRHKIKNEKAQVFCVAGCQSGVPQVVDTKPGIFAPGFMDHEPEETEVVEVAKYFWCEPGGGCTALGEPHYRPSISVHVYRYEQW